MRRIAAVARKELKQIRRDPLSLLILLGVPALMLLLYGYAINFDVRHVALAVEDRSRSAASRELVASFVNSTYFDLALDVTPGTDYHDVLARRLARGVLVIPEDFATDIAAGRTASVQLVLDGADAQSANTVLGYATALVQDAGLRLSATALGATGVPIAYDPRVLYNPELKSSQFLVPGLIGFILMITAVISTAISVVREKERGTLEQLRVTSLTPSEIVLGKTLPYLGISLLATVVILVVARVLFGVAVAGSYLDLFIATLIYLVGALAFGLVVSSVAKSQAMAFQMGALASMLPAIFLSGFIFPLRSMPGWLQVISFAVPARYYLIVARGVMLKGAGLLPYARNVLFLSLYALVMLVVAHRRLTRRED